MNDFKYVEQEFTELRTHLEKSFSVLDGLAQIQTQFEELAQTYQQLKEHLEKAKTTPENTSGIDEEKLHQRFLALETSIESKLGAMREEFLQVQDHAKMSFADISQIKEAFEHRCKQLETLTESLWKEMREQLVNAQNQMDAANRNLGVQLNQQVGNVKYELESKMAAILQQWANQKTDLMSAFDQLSEDGCDRDDFRKLDNRIQTTKTSIRSLEKQVKTLRVGLFFAISTAVLSVIASLFLLNSAVTQKETPQEDNTPDEISPSSQRKPLQKFLSQR